MKKKILGLLLALCLVVGLLPVTAFAAAETITVTMTGLEWKDIAEGTHKYATTNDAGSATECTESDAWNIHLDYTAGQTPTLYLKNAKLTTTTSGTAALKVATKGAFVLNSVEGATNTLISNVVSSYSAYPLNLVAVGGTTVTGSGKLIAKNDGDNNATAVNHAAAAIGTAYNLTFKDADVELSVKDASYHPVIAMAGIADTEAHMPGLLVFDGGSAKLTNLANGRAIAYMVNSWAQGTSNNSALTSKTVTIKNGANVQITGNGNASPIGAAGGVIVDKATLEISMNATNGQSGWTEAELPKFPQTVGAHTVEYKYAKGDTALKSFLSTDTTDADYIAADTDMTAIAGYINYLKISYNCIHKFDNDCTTADKCAYCNEVAEAKTAHVFDTDCTTADTCQNAGCEAKADAKAAHVFDNDCTTADKCANCETKADANPVHAFDKDCKTADKCANCDVVATAGTHVFDTDCTTADKCATCDAVAEAKSAHVFDKDCTTADTCQNAGCAVKAKAGSHIFDKDCTTADKCTSCGTAATAEKAHKYTNNADTTCDNPGCEHTRKVEAGGENPKTGDNTALVLCIVVMLTSAAAFVFTKKRIAL